MGAPCDRCEELLQDFLDRTLSDAEWREAETHLSDCDYCRRRYRFEETLRGKGGPEPVPDFSLVRVVGCLDTDASEGAWVLLSSSHPSAPEIPSRRRASWKRLNPGRLVQGPTAFSCRPRTNRTRTSGTRSK